MRPDATVLEHAFTCPYCWETVTMLLDLSAATQSYIEDCEVCCNPIEVTFSTDGHNLDAFSADSC
ncbi:MAG: CPXCG motif-containing cysteine-rich protein [Pseudomonadota bacterium]